LSGVGESLFGREHHIFRPAFELFPCLLEMLVVGFERPADGCPGVPDGIRRKTIHDGGWNHGRGAGHSRTQKHLLACLRGDCDAIVVKCREEKMVFLLVGGDRKPREAEVAALAAKLLDEWLTDGVLGNIEGDIPVRLGLSPCKRASFRRPGPSRRRNGGTSSLSSCSWCPS